MGLQGIIQPDPAQMSRFELIILGQPLIVFTKVAGLEEELEVITLPDRSEVSSGNTKPITFTATSMMHHAIEMAFLTEWWNEGKGDVTLTHKKEGMLLYKKTGGSISNTLILTELFMKKRKFSDLDTKNESDAAEAEWTFSAKLLV